LVWRIGKDGKSDNIFQLRMQPPTKFTCSHSVEVKQQAKPILGASELVFPIYWRFIRYCEQLNGGVVW